MHDLDIVHGGLKTVRSPPHFWHPARHMFIPFQENILVDLCGTARIAGFGSALILGHATVWSEMSAERSFRGSAPELVCPERFGLGYPHGTKASDVYAFGVLAWEVSVSMEFSKPRIRATSLGFRRTHYLF